MLAPHADVGALRKGKPASPSKMPEKISSFEERPDLKFGPREEVFDDLDNKMPVGALLARTKTVNHIEVVHD
jgi:hypothetical protein